MTARRTLTILLAATALLVPGCGQELHSPPDRTVGYNEPPPLPVNAAPAATNSPPPPDIGQHCGDPTASLRPVDVGRGPNLDAIRARGRLVVGTDASTSLFSFRDPVSGTTLAGFDIDIAKEIARDLFGDPERVEYRMLGSDERERVLQEHTVDVVVKTMTVTCDRRQDAAFSSVYLMAHQRVLAVKNSGITDLADLAGKRVCVVPGTTSLDRIRREQPAASILTVPTWDDCLVVLQQREVDAVSTDDMVLAGLAVQDPNIEVVGGNIADEPYAVGIPKGNDDVVRFVNATLERIRADGTWDRLYRHWLSPLLGPSPGPPRPHYAD
ncbi:glutamate ABC transporter substrate-binding protein [Nocardia sp. NEAU-G5]|uniref:Glutamate ABC transporter substrate-binding protein n=1 Tax=Nocardia albiluteola TaxID=2842303 RepID=A0ABS6AV21_9NOCA|nr:glutamate ABC transporter substrate-binding protein [Nocardia albiluteola]MBU3061878.1 glutamate ABC transporter substrate-binding protein [Nocardia albiluteola]